MIIYESRKKELRLKIIDLEIAMTGEVLSITENRGYRIKWHNGYRQWIKSRNVLTEMWKGMKRYEVIND